MNSNIQAQLGTSEQGIREKLASIRERPAFIIDRGKGI